MTSPENEFTTFDEMVLVGDLAEVQQKARQEAEQGKGIDQKRIELKGHFARVAELGLEETERPEAPDGIDGPEGIDESEELEDPEVD